MGARLSECGLPLLQNEYVVGEQAECSKQLLRPDQTYFEVKSQRQHKVRSPLSGRIPGFRPGSYDITLLQICGSRLGVQISKNKTDPITTI
jgi:hypothetical protein